jgi:hypothetical protein
MEDKFIFQYKILNICFYIQLQNNKKFPIFRKNQNIYQKKRKTILISKRFKKNGIFTNFKEQFFQRKMILYNGCKI